MSTVESSNPTPSRRRLGDVKAVAAMLCCDDRTIYRRADEGAIPPGFKLGALRRWDLQALEDWIAAGCPRIRPVMLKRGRP